VKILKFDQDLAQAILQNISDPEIKLKKNFAERKKGLFEKWEQMPLIAILKGGFHHLPLQRLFLK